MKTLLFFLILLNTLLFSKETYENYVPQKFFDRSDIDTFFKNETGELLKKIIVNGKDYYLQQDGDLFDEDVATIDEEIFSARDQKFSFGRSKRLLATKVYPSHQRAFYSGCKYVVQEKKLIPVAQTCGFHYRKNKNR